MANIPRAPFYAPRPSDDPVWGGPALPSNIIRLLTQQKMFGVGGQGPTKDWAPCYTLDDPPMWQGNPTHSAIIPLLTQQKFFGAGGQVPQKLWTSIYTQDDPAVTYPTPQNSKIIPLLTQQKVFGAGGQVWTKQWSQVLTYDDSAFWPGTPLGSNLLHPLLTAAGQVTSRQWLWGYDDAAFWVGTPIGSYLINPLLTAGGKPFAKQYRADYDDAAVFYTWTNRNNPILAPTSNPFAQRQQNVGYDDSAVWVGHAIANQLLFPLLTAAGQVKPRQWTWGLDDASVWTGQGSTSPAINMLTAGGKPFSKQTRFDYDDYAVFYTWTNRNSVALAPSAAPFTQRQQPGGLDDSAIWTGAPSNSPTLNALTAGGKPFSKGWHYDNDDPGVWYTWINRNLATLTIVAAPFTQRQQRFENDDAAVWYQYTWINRNTLIQTPQPKPFIPLAWLFGYDDASLWTWQAPPVPTSILGPLPPIVPMAQYILRVDHYIKDVYIPVDTLVTEGKELPIGWIPTPAAEPINTQAIQAYWNAGPFGVSSAQYSLDFFNSPFWQFPKVKMKVYWVEVGGQPGYFQLTGAGASLGAKRSG